MKNTNEILQLMKERNFTLHTESPEHLARSLIESNWIREASNKMSELEYGGYSQMDTIAMVGDKYQEVNGNRNLSDEHFKDALVKVYLDTLKIDQIDLDKIEYMFGYRSSSGYTTLLVIQFKPDWNQSGIMESGKTHLWFSQTSHNEWSWDNHHLYSDSDQEVTHLQHFVADAPYIYGVSEYGSNLYKSSEFVEVV